MKKLYLAVIKLRSNLKNEFLKLISLKTLIINELEQTSKRAKVTNLEKSYLYYSILTLTKSKYFVSYMIKLHC